MTRRRTRFLKRMLVGALGTAVVIGTVAGGYKALSHSERQAISADPTGADAAAGSQQPAGPKASDGKAAANPIDPKPTPGTKPVPLKTEKADKKPLHASNQAMPAVYFDAPTTRPATALTAASQPSGFVVPKAAPKTGAADVPALLADADAKTSADDLVAARNSLNTALQTKTFKPSDEAEAVARLAKINDAVVFGPRKFLSDPGQTAYQVQAGDNLQKIANKFDTTVGFIQRVNNISDPRKLRLGQSLKIIKGPFHALVNKTAFTLDLYQGQPGTAGAVLLKRLRVGLGENDSTPTGLWKIGTKLINPTYYNSRNEGPRVVDANDPKNPLGERWLALEGVSGQAVGKESYGIHGTIDPDSIGKKMSMGCIRLLDDDVKLVYDMLVKDKSTVTVTE